jgi:hypothetical protein
MLNDAGKGEIVIGRSVLRLLGERYRIVEEPSLGTGIMACPSPWGTIIH